MAMSSIPQLLGVHWRLTAYRRPETVAIRARNFGSIARRPGAHQRYPLISCLTERRGPPMTAASALSHGFGRPDGISTDSVICSGLIAASVGAVASFGAAAVARTFSGRGRLQAAVGSKESVRSKRWPVSRW
jgi:hypothetical protein